jgi:hypothetical protein
MFLRKIGELLIYRKSFIIKFCVRSTDTKAVGRPTFNSVAEKVTTNNKRGITEVNLQAHMVC